VLLKVLLWRGDRGKLVRQLFVFRPSHLDILLLQGLRLLDAEFDGWRGGVVVGGGGLELDLGGDLVLLGGGGREELVELGVGVGSKGFGVHRARKKAG
jgi:hypothetical protein